MSQDPPISIQETDLRADASQRARRRLRRGPAIRCGAVVLALIALPVVQILSPQVAEAQPSIDQQLSSAQAQVNQISTTINADQQKLDALDEQYNEARIRVAQDAQNVQAAQVKLRRAQMQESATQARLRQEAVAAYVQGGSVASLGALVNGSSDNLAVRSYYVDQSSNEVQQIVAQLRDQQHQISQERAVYSQALSADTIAKTQVQSALQNEQSTTANLTSQLSFVKSHYAQLYAQKQQEEAAARAAAAQAAAEAAQRAEINAAPTGPAPPVNGRAGTAVQAALGERGVPYVWGGASPSEGFDCSGLVMWAWAQAGVSLAHGSIAQYYETTRVSYSQLEPGDLVFYSPPGDPPLGHVAMFIGNNEVVQGLTTGTLIQVTSMFYVGPPVGYGRVG